MSRKQWRVGGGDFGIEVSLVALATKMTLWAVGGSFSHPLLGTHIKGYQCEIPLRESRTRPPLYKVYRYFLPVLVSNCKFEISTVLLLCPKYRYDNIINKNINMQ